MDYDQITTFVDHLTRRENLMIAAGLLVLLGCFILLIRRQPKQIVAYKTEGGSVLVARSAIRELVQSACEQLDGVSKPKTRIRIKRGRVHFDVSVKLVGTNQLKQVESTLQLHMRRALTENLGIEKLGNINVIATGFKSGRIDQTQIKTAAKAATPHVAATAPQDDFEVDPESANPEPLEETHPDPESEPKRRFF